MSNRGLDDSSASAPRFEWDAPAADGYFHPSSEEAIVALVRRAAKRGLSLRVRGSAHSVAESIGTDAMRDGEGRAIDVMLDRYVGVSVDVERMEVTASAGCHLGPDPRDPTGTSTFDDSLVGQLDRRGLALPDLGGVTHQTVAGFVSTGSCGGTIMHAFESAIVGMRLIDGLGRVHDLRRGRDAWFDAAGCSMGLLGVISTLTFRCVPRYDIVGVERIENVETAAVRLFDEGEHGLAEYVRKTEYARLMWWPQRGVRRLVTWSARRMRDADYDATTGPRDAFVPKTYSALGEGFSGSALAGLVGTAAQAAGGAFYDAVAAATRLSMRLEERVPAAAERAGAWVAKAFEAGVLPTVIDLFVPLDTARPQRFWDSWWNGLPMDNQMSERFLPTAFTEIFIPLDRTAEALEAMREHFEAHGLRATGTFLVELYAAPASRFWMHPSYGRDSMRIDVFWFARNPGDPAETYFPQFWELLAPFGYRLHWGKYLPRTPELGAAYLRRQLPRWDAFLALRAELDPNGVFLSRYWKEALGIA